MKIQDWLRQNDGDLELLEQELGIKTVVNDDNRVIFNYSMIDSPKGNKIVRECRGLTLDAKNNWELVARAFPRFFNIPEFPNEFANFDFKNCLGYHKEDGSLLVVYYWNGEWRFNTRGSFGEGEINYSGITWRELALKAISPRFFNHAQSRYTYVFELCSRHNKIVRNYSKPQAFLLTIYNKEDELSFEDCLRQSDFLGLEMPYVSRFFSIEDVEDYIELMANDDPTFEGIVLRDCNSRWKVKSKVYLSLHRICNNGDPCHPKNIIPLILTNEVDEIICYFNEIEPYVQELKKRIEQAKTEVDNLWYCYYDEPSQKKFAMAIKNSPHAGVLFKARKLDLNPLDLMDSDYFVKYFMR